MEQLDWRLVALIGLCSILLFSVLQRRFRQWRASRIARRRGARAVAGEAHAERLLQDHGYVIVDRQVRTSWRFDCDDEEVVFELRADLVVERDGERFVAEVKTGRAAPDLRNAATRRQLLEYALAYQSPTLLLVDVEGGEIHRIVFPMPGDAPSRNDEEAASRDSLLRALGFD